MSTPVSCTKEFTVPGNGIILYFYAWRASDSLYRLVKLDLDSGVDTDLRITGYNVRTPSIANNSVIYYVDDNLPVGVDSSLEGYSRIGTDGLFPVRLVSDEGEYRGNSASGADLVLVDDVQNTIYYLQSSGGPFVRVGRTASGEFTDASKLSVVAGSVDYTAAIDLTNSKIYWVVDNVGTSDIYRANLDGSSAEVFYTSTYPVIQAIAISPNGQKIFWIECAGDLFDDPVTPSTIYSGNLSGALSKTSLLVVETLVDPADTLLYSVGLAASPNRLYFTFAVSDGGIISRGRIKSIPHAGGTPTAHLTEDDAEYYGLVIGYPYFSAPVEPPAQAGIQPKLWLVNELVAGTEKVYEYNLDGSSGTLRFTRTDVTGIFEIYAENNQVFWWSYASQIMEWGVRGFWTVGSFNPTPTLCNSIHVTTTKVYMIDSSDQIWSWNLDGTGQTLLYTGAADESLHSLTVDEVNGWIYFSLHFLPLFPIVGSKIYKMTLAGGSKTLIANGLDEPFPNGSYWSLRLTVDPGAGYLFFYERGNARIVRCNLSGGSQTVIISGLPDYVWTMVAHGSYLYYFVKNVTAGTDRVYRADYNGNGITLLIDLAYAGSSSMHVG